MKYNFMERDLFFGHILIYNTNICSYLRKESTMKLKFTAQLPKKVTKIRIDDIVYINLKCLRFLNLFYGLNKLSDLFRR